MAYYPNNPNGQNTAANSSPVVLASDQSTLNVRVTNFESSTGTYTWKSYNTTTTVTGAAIWTPTTSTFISIFYISIASYGTTAGRVILWFGSSVDTTYTAGTDQLVFAGSFAPSSTSKPGAIIQPNNLIIANSSDYVLRITTDAAISLDITVYGYETTTFP